MRYQVFRQYERGTEEKLATFKEVSEARLYIDAKLPIDASMKVKVKYRIKDHDMLIEEIGQEGATAVAATQSSDQGSQGMGSSSSARATPFSMAPRAPGTMPVWGANQKEDDQKKK